MVRYKDHVWKQLHVSAACLQLLSERIGWMMWTGHRTTVCLLKQHRLDAEKQKETRNKSIAEYNSSGDQLKKHILNIYSIAGWLDWIADVRKWSNLFCIYWSDLKSGSRYFALLTGFTAKCKHHTNSINNLLHLTCTEINWKSVRHYICWMSLSGFIHKLTFCDMLLRVVTFYTWLLLYVTLLCISQVLLMFPRHTEEAARHWNSIVSWEKCLRLVFKNCVGWVHVDLNTFSGDMPRPLLSGVSLAEL